MLAIGRGLMCHPKLLLLDEPSLGLSPILTSEVGSIIKRIADEGVSILLIEQNANLALQLAKKNYVMETGTIALEGDSKQLQNNDHVKAAYLGISATDESPVILAQEKKAPKTPAPERWQDKGPQGRWQDQYISESTAPQRKGQEGRAQDRRVSPGESTVMRPEDNVMQEGGAQTKVSRDLEPSDRWAQESRLPAGDSSDRWVQDRGAPERWQDREAPDRWLDREAPRRWQAGEPVTSQPRDRWQDREPPGRRPEYRETPGWPQDRGERPPERWLDQGPRETWRDREVQTRGIKDRWPEEKQAPSRVVKKTFVPKVGTKT